MNQQQLDKIVSKLSELSAEDIRKIINALELELLAKAM